MRIQGAAVTIALSVGIAVAHTGATGIVKERMDGMGELASAMKRLSAIVKSGGGDAIELRALGETIMVHSGAAMLERFPEGSLPDVSEASPAIWTDWQKFSEISMDLHSAASELMSAAGTPKMDLPAIVQEIGATCGACHKDFRIKK